MTEAPELPVPGHTDEEITGSKVVGGSHRYSLIVLGGEFGSTRLLPDSGRVVIGRSSVCDVVIDDPSVSREHAALFVGSVLEIEDLGSANGVVLRGVTLPPCQRAPFAVGEPLELGAATVVVQRKFRSARPRRVWQHDYFEGRVDEECERAKRKNGCFAVILVTCEPKSEGAVQEALTATLRPTDPMGQYAPGEYEVLVVEVDAAEAEAIIARFENSLKAKAVEARIGLAIYGFDGRSSGELLSLARRRASLLGKAATKPRTDGFVISPDGVLRRLVERVAPSSISVLIVGETGVGKEVLAEEIHRRSLRSSGPLLRLHCAALPEALLESELFGHERGAFTGAVTSKQGLLESATGGTIFLDEIGELPISMQVKLLRVLEERKIRRVGGLEARPIDVRFISATNRDLEAEIARGAFRQDLYFRLNGVLLVVPPLRERGHQIEQLCFRLLEDICKKEGRQIIPSIDPGAMVMLKGYGWPGNIRELRNVLERAVLLTDRAVIGVEHLPVAKMEATLPVAQPPSAPSVAPQVSQPPPPPEGAAESPALRGKAARTDPAEHVERIRAALNQVGGSQKEAAELLGVSRRTLINWIIKYDLPRPRKGRGTRS